MIFRIGKLLIVLTLIVGCSRFGPRDKQNVSRVSYPLILKGIEVGGVKASFQVDEYSSATGSLKGKVFLRNGREAPVDFKMYELFSRHLEIRGPAGKAVNDSPRFVFYEYVAATHRIEPQGTVRVPFSVVIPEFFDIRPGEYEVWFVCSESLYKKAGKDRYKRWSTRAFPISFKPL